ncbi:hypothetical protein ACFQXA_22965 [Nocardiopsis composta]
MHLIVVGRDTTGYRHLHPEMDADGLWTVRTGFDTPGPYRMFADFAPEGAEDGLVLGADVALPGDYEPEPLPGVRRVAEVDGYTVRLEGGLAAGGSGDLDFTVTKDGEPVDDLEPYLGAYGHLVALRAGDLAYLHVHPHGEPGDGETEPGPEVRFSAEAPTPATTASSSTSSTAGRSAPRSSPRPPAAAPAAAAGTATTATGTDRPVRTSTDPPPRRTQR